MFDTTQSEEIAKVWLAEFADAIASGDSKVVAQTFLPDGWLRDVLTFTWDLRALEGRDKISAYLTDTLAPANVTNIALDQTPHLGPETEMFSPKEGHGISFAFTYETRVARGRGYARLMPDTVDSKWKGWAVCMMVEDLKGYEERGYESGIWEGHTAAWCDVLAGRHADVEKDPFVLVVGAGQTGLTVAARLKQMGVSTLTIERLPRVGDVWRNRYPTLALHTPKQHHQMLYQPYPSNWPLYTPRDKVADWLESYSLNQDLAIWTSSEIQGQPPYNDSTGRWDVTINRKGTLHLIHPAHIVLCTGGLGSPQMPVLRNQEEYQGEVFHGSAYKGGAPYAGKRVVVVGTGNTAIDVCQDLCTHKAASVTMVQRSPTCVVSSSNTTKRIRENWADDVPTEVADFKFGTLPFGARWKVMKTLTDFFWKEEEELHAKLRKGGMKLWQGEEGQGQFLMVYGRGGGYWLDVGGSDLIASGDIKIKHGTPAAFTERTLVFRDGSEVEADVVVMATGYEKIRNSNKALFGEETINRTCEICGYDGEGELRGGYRPTGHPGLWYAIGDFWTVRQYSKHLAIQLKALEIGLYDNKLQTIKPVKGTNGTNGTTNGISGINGTNGTNGTDSIHVSEH